MNNFKFYKKTKHNILNDLFLEQVLTSKQGHELESPGGKGLKSTYFQICSCVVAFCSRGTVVPDTDSNPAMSRLIAYISLPEPERTFKNKKSWFQILTKWKDHRRGETCFLVLIPALTCSQRFWWTQWWYLFLVESVASSESDTRMELVSHFHRRFHRCISAL